jgi:hypothetical protein
LFSDISRALYRVLVSTFPEINLIFMGRGTSQAQQHQISVTNNHWQSCMMKKGGTPSGQRAGTQKRLWDKEDEKTPDVKTQREEDDKEAKRNFFSRDTARHSLKCLRKHEQVCHVQLASYERKEKTVVLCPQGDVFPQDYQILSSTTTYACCQGRMGVQRGDWGERWGLQKVPKGFSAVTVQQQRGAKN